MQIENEFEVAAPPDTVFAFLLDVNRVAGCMPGAELAEVVDPTTFKGRVKIKVGPITVAYNGTARIVEKDESARLARLEASGRETTGPGSANATATMTVTPRGDASVVKLATDFTVAGRVANFGRGVMEDVSRRLVGQMADCIKANLEDGPAPVAAAAAAPAPSAFTPPGQAAPAASPAAPAPAGAPAAPPTPEPRPVVATARPVNALGLMFSILWERLRRLFGRR